jgi:Tfp pilus assembly protein PilX
VVLVLALIVLVAMTLAALSLMRSVDTSNLVAGNVALKQAAVQEADRIMNVAFACLDSGGTLLSQSLENDNSTCNYYASMRPDTVRPFGVPDVLETVSGVTDPVTGNTSSYVIERMCSTAGAWSSDTCVESPFGRASSYTKDDRPGALTPPQGLYRISVKVSGPRNVAAYSQMVMNAGT